MRSVDGFSPQGRWTSITESIIWTSFLLFQTGATARELRTFRTRQFLLSCSQVAVLQKLTEELVAMGMYNLHVTSFAHGVHDVNYMRHLAFSLGIYKSYSDFLSPFTSHLRICLNEINHDQP